MDLRLIVHESPEYEEMIRLRMRILRTPLGLSFSADDLAAEKKDILIGAWEKDKMIGCCVLTPRNETTIQLRQMAVDTDLQGKNMGAAILAYAEKVAGEKGFEVLMMHAREVAAGFYKKFGYEIVGDLFIEVTIPHFHMEKKLL